VRTHPALRSVAALGAAILVTTSPVTGAGAEALSAGSAGTRADSTPMVGAEESGAVKDRYIVVFKKDASPSVVRSARDDARNDGGRIHYEYGTALKGFAATLPAKAVNRLRGNPQVDYLEPDQEVRASVTQPPSPPSSPPWGLDRVDQLELPLSDDYTYTATGVGVTAYVIDTGIRATHSEFGFGVRAPRGHDVFNPGSLDISDCNGHGTHVAGTIGGSTYGIAKQVTLVSVRVLDCNGSGTTSGVIAGVDWVTADHSYTTPAVANMSLGGGSSTALDAAVSASIDAGVTYAIAAGNDSRNACNYSPARVASAITVGATTLDATATTDVRASYSNHGGCLDLFAPGSNITSAWKSSDIATKTISGTSMATPHVAGAAALYLEGAGSASPSAVGQAIVDGATSGVVRNIRSGSPNKLLCSLLPSGCA